MSKNKLYRIPQQGKLKGVCAGIADYLGIPVLLVRVIVVLSMFCGLFIFTLIAYFALAAVLDEMPLSVQGQDKPLSAHQLLDELSAELNGGEQQLREVERYVTSETFSVRSRFRQL
ncbi:envelope stress response membrane protein PspC [Erwinia aphidicola]|jgi:phage shock protein C|uniref:Envelope stress response membrane protein PspC n=1 Tax=Erwinia aphidicola TaxID=68334 RepID=A0ABU8DG67_ERWAP|nr:MULTISPECIES: envelope stress response membrane protein PspC [Erwinia]KMV70756.1 transcriptional regulator [bacteria symbiont BFo1 of Frankliniella occidentalis]PIJ58121.1 DNA-binding transcriptional activator PspC [Erwinia sp. OLMDLW33]KYP84925.1 transcriptional regulator [bacteria symbiont BFo1 of Frankliniella occidentalis]KYP90174.1 transcriptional regulator [bacteria symbiont BFo1 of Frankliniella occidentalis]MBD1374633.1 envelope stress response membrane protein PspC [Erwinia aphidic